MNVINWTCLAAAIADGYGNVDDLNDLHYYDGAIHDRHGRFAPVPVVGDDVASAAQAAVETYNAVVAARRLAVVA